MQLVIDRKTWLRGESNSALLRPSDQKMCCVGFYCLALGLTREQILGKPWPYKGETELPESAQWLQAHWENNPDCELAQINDRSGISDAQREPKIAEIFARHGVEVEFVN